jgi:hypothetical protein
MVLLLVLVLVLVLLFCIQAIMYKVIEVHGSALGWNWVYYIFTFFRWAE